MSKLSAAMTLARLAPAQRRDLLTAAWTLLLCRAKLASENIESLRAWAARPGDGRREAEHLAFAAKIAAKHLPGMTCLSRALALQHLLSANGHASELTIGVENPGDGFGAHAWLTCEGRILTGGEEAQGFQPLTVWAAPRRRTEEAERLT